MSQGMRASGQIKIIAHCGASFLALENTVATAVLAWGNSADAVECDIWLRRILSQDLSDFTSRVSAHFKTTGTFFNNPPYCELKMWNKKNNASIIVTTDMNLK